MQPANEAGAYAPANNNAPSLWKATADYARLLEAEKVAALKQWHQQRSSSHQSEFEPVLAWPALSRLIEAGQHGKAAALKRWRDLCQPVAWQTGLQAANDNGSSEEGWERARWAEPSTKTERMDVERNSEVRPTVNELVSATNRVAVISTRWSKGHWSTPMRREHQLDIRSGVIVGHFRNGAAMPLG